MKNIFKLFLILTISGKVSAQRTCATDACSANLQQLYPKLQDISSVIKNNTLRANYILEEVNDVITIPVVVNVVLKDISLVTKEQIQSQIDVLNEDFSGMNSDLKKVPFYFQKCCSNNTNIKFVLDTIIWVNTTKKYFLIDTKVTNNIQRDEKSDPIKFTKTGGIPPTSPTSKLNIWVADIRYRNNITIKNEDLPGYTLIPPVPINIDGVLINYKNFGRINVSSVYFNRGRTATHEIGHYLGLKHLWGDTDCGDDDIEDTPKQSMSMFGCYYGIRENCNHDAYGEMYMNFMSYCNDECIYMFTSQQARRMRQSFALYRPSFFQEERPDSIPSIDLITQEKNQAIITINNHTGSDSSRIFIKKVQDNNWQTLVISDTVYTKGLAPGALYEVKVQDLKHESKSIDSLPSTFFITENDKFKKNKPLEIINGIKK